MPCYTCGHIFSANLCSDLRSCSTAEAKSKGVRAAYSRACSRCVFTLPSQAASHCMVASLANGMRSQDATAQDAVVARQYLTDHATFVRTARMWTGMSPPQRCNYLSCPAGTCPCQKSAYLLECASLSCHPLACPASRRACPKARMPA